MLAMTVCGGSMYHHQASRVFITYIYVMLLILKIGKQSYVIPILQVKKLKLRASKLCFKATHLLSDWNLSPSEFDSKPELFSLGWQ